MAPPVSFSRWLARVCIQDLKFIVPKAAMLHGSRVDTYQRLSQPLANRRRRFPVEESILAKFRLRICDHLPIGEQRRCQVSDRFVHQDSRKTVVMVQAHDLAIRLFIQRYRASRSVEANNSKTFELVREFPLFRDCW